MELYFTNPENINTSGARFDPFESKHILKTMRKTVGDTIHFTDGRGRLFSGPIKNVRPELFVSPLTLEKKEMRTHECHIGIGFIRHARLDILIEKGTEAGVTKFYLFKSRNANFFTSNTRRWEKIGRQAIKQSQRLFLPEIQAVDNFEALFNLVSYYKFKYIMHQDSPSLLNHLPGNNRSVSEGDTICLVGPEGGFEQFEIELAEHKYNFLPVSLGNTRLRTETAAIVAASIISLIKN